MVAFVVQERPHHFEPAEGHDNQLHILSAAFPSPSKGPAGDRGVGGASCPQSRCAPTHRFDQEVVGHVWRDEGFVLRGVGMGRAAVAGRH